jgi:excisionase family DNA binding protein
MSNLTTELFKFYTLKQAVGVSGLSRTTLWKWIRTGTLPSYRVGREVLIEKTVLEDYLRGR